MLNLFVNYAMINNNFLNLISFFMLLSTILVVTSWNPIMSILFLISLFGFASLYLYFNGLAIMSLLYILIYIGAIAILFLFILSLLNIQYNDFSSVSLFRDMSFIIITSFLIFIFCYKYLNTNFISFYPFIINHFFIINYSTINLYNLFNYNYFNIFPLNDLAVIGTLLYTQHSLLLILIAIILLLSIIGAISITIHNK